MSPEEEKEELKKDLPVEAADEAAPAEEAEEAEEPRTAAEKKERKIWPAALGLTLFVLAGGGYYAMTGMRTTAHELGGGEDYDELAANSSVYDGMAGSRGAAGGQAAFPLDEEEARREAAVPQAGRLNTALTSTKEELLSKASGGAVHIPQASAEAEGGGGGAQPRQQQQGVMAQKLQARAFLSSGPGAARSKGAAPAAGVVAFGNRTAVGQAAAQRDTTAAKPKQAAKGSVLDALKGTFKASFYGARLASHDAAKNWVARTFDGSPEATTAIEYDDKMRASLDRVNPGSIPNFLREQDVSVAEAKRLSDSAVARPELNKEATKESLANSQEVQRKKMIAGLGGGMLNGLFAGVSGTGSEGGEGEDEGGGGGPGVFASEEDTEDLRDQEMQDWINTYGFGESCGCTQAAPCCCLNNMGGAGISSDVP